MRINLRRHTRTASEEPEINLIAFIDVLLVILIFLMLSTTYNKFTEMNLRLPTAEAETPRDRPREILITIHSDGGYSINRAALPGRNVQDVIAALRQVMGNATNGKDAVLIISADANARHQSVVSAMEAARYVGLSQITFAAQSPESAGR
ncbi:biopolymer transporter ExbD [Hylemonella gracilis str. Niagara R]|uniref:Biopolymer transporter ExbD n=1 Tax=Hylemonella gracilis str. Niagara R TaxID=1458275 RepID=A0A016XIF5_9BURK|nr:biopolymer transporter ExbD [Hylemonella gracilis]EYC50988.1 biopolymer transporter ExbD [Hylemonella gracilis str. Niagara R]